MSKKNVLTGITVGAICGFAVTLINKDNREYVKRTTSQALNTADFYMNHPSEGVKNVKSGITHINAYLSENSSKAINALDQVENTIRKYLK